MSGKSEVVAVTPEGISIQSGIAENANNTFCSLIEEAGETASNIKNFIKWTNHGYKHFPLKNMSWNDILKSTKNGAAKYKPGIDIKNLELHAWHNGQNVTVSGKNWKVFKCNEIIGASSGKETCYMRIECSANTVHGHPILESDYLRYLK